MDVSSTKLYKTWVWYHFLNVVFQCVNMFVVFLNKHFFSLLLWTSRTSFVFEQSGSPLPGRGLILLVARRLELSAILNCARTDGNGCVSPFLQVNVQVLRSLVASRCQLERLQWIHGLEKFMFYEPGVFIQRLDSIFAKKKSCLFCVDRSPTLASASYLATLL